PHPYGTVERLPAVLPVFGDVVAADASEHLPEQLLPRRVGVRHELDTARALDLLEPGREELEHLRPSLLHPGAGDRDRDASQRAQRNALLSFSKKLSSALYVSSAAVRSNSS